jgi:hypothetical protein
MDLRTFRIVQPGPEGWDASHAILGTDIFVGLDPSEHIEPSLLDSGVGR